MTRGSLGFHCHRLEHIEEGILKNDLNRGEFYNFPPEEIPALKLELASKELARSVHAPLVRPEWYPNPPTLSFLCDVDKDNRNLTLRMINESIAQAEDIGAEYLVVHFPSPSTDASGESREKLLSIAWRSCDQLAELSVKRGMPIHIEGLGDSPFLDLEFLGKALSEYPLRYCFDTGHMHLASQLNNFDLYEFAAGIAPFVGSIHLWNSRGQDDYLNFRHIPVHPSQDPEEGWADIKRLLKILKPSCPIIFESPPSYPSALGDFDWRDGIKWVREILEQGGEDDPEAEADEH